LSNSPEYSVRYDGTGAKNDPKKNNYILWSSNWQPQMPMFSIINADYVNVTILLNEDNKVYIVLQLEGVSNGPNYE